MLIMHADRFRFGGTAREYCHRHASIFTGERLSLNSFSHKVWQGIRGERMIQKIEAERRHYSDFDWLKTHWLFSFAEYYDPDNIQFGALRFKAAISSPGNRLSDTPAS